MFIVIIKLAIFNMEVHYIYRNVFWPLSHVALAYIQYYIQYYV